MMELLTATQIICACAAMTAGATIQGAAGFGVALVAAPFLVLIDPRLVPGPIIAAGIALNLLMMNRERKDVRFGEMKWVVLGILPGAVLGAALLSYLPLEMTGIVVGLAVLAAVVMSLIGARVRVTVSSLLGAGVLSGFMGTATSLGGPPIALLLQDERGARLRGSLAACFFFGSLISLAALAFVGRFGIYELTLAALLLPGILLGFAVSGRLTGVLDRGYTRPAVLGLSSLAATAVLIRAIF